MISSSTVRRGRWVLALTILLIACLGLAGCDDAEASDTTTDPPPPPTSTEEPKGPCASGTCEAGNTDYTLTLQQPAPASDGLCHYEVTIADSGCCKLNQVRISSRNYENVSRRGGTCHDVSVTTDENAGRTNFPQFQSDDPAELGCGDGTWTVTTQPEGNECPGEITLTLQFS